MSSRPTHMSPSKPTSNQHPEGPIPKAGTVADADGKASLSLLIQELPNAGPLVRLDLKSAGLEQRALGFDSLELKSLARHEIPVREAGPNC